MPSGRVHASSNVVMIAANAVLATPPEIKIPVGAGLLAGIVLSPDLDVDAGYIGLSILRNVWGLSMAWRIFWWPYAKLVPHRSPISHWPILGTIIRLAYLCLPAFIICGLLHIPFDPWNSDFFHWLFVGLVISDSMHFFLDTMTGEIRSFRH